MTLVNKTVVCDSVGFYKVPILPDVGKIYQVNVRENDILGDIEQTHYIIVEDVCLEAIAVKWLTSEGFYKFGAFNKYKRPSEVSKTDLVIPKYFTAFADTDTRAEVVSKTRQKNIVLSKRQVPTTVFNYYFDLASSPRVYLFIDNKWIKVQVNWAPSYPEKKQFHNIAVTFLLPESYIQRL